MRTCFLYLVVMMMSLFSQSQNVPVIKVKKNQVIYFFQEGTKTDTLSFNKGTRFYLVVSDSLKEQTVIDVENGQLGKTTNDSIVELKFTPGIRYESFFSPGDNTKNSNTPTFEYRVRINGTATTEANRIRIRIIDRKKEEVQFETFYYFR